MSAQPKPRRIANRQRMTNQNCGPPGTGERPPSAAATLARSVFTSEEIREVEDPQESCKQDQSAGDERVQTERADQKQMRAPARTGLGLRQQCGDVARRDRVHGVVLWRDERSRNRQDGSRFGVAEARRTRPAWSLTPCDRCDGATSRDHSVRPRFGARRVR
jgi:hypothetical protein